MKSPLRRFLSILAVATAAFAGPVAAQEYFDTDVDLPAYPEMQPVEGLPVYWAPTVDANYFFYDGLFWDFYNDGWYASPWYNGPWSYVDPVYVPTYVLWVPVRYYHHPAPYFHHGGGHDKPPRWGAHWGPHWQQAHNRVYAGQRPSQADRAPLPQYQRQFTRANYPRAAQQQAQVHNQNYAWQPREQVVRQQYQARGMQPQARVAQQQQHPQQPQSPGGQGHHGANEPRGR